MKRDELLDLNEALQNPGKVLHFHVKTALEQEADLDLLEPVTGDIEAVSTGNILLLEGTFQARCVLECARCGAAIEQTLDIEMDDDFPVEGVPACYGGKNFAKVAPEPEPEPLFKDNNLIQDRYVRQGLLVSIPIQPLCEHGWDGPCPNAQGAKPGTGAKTRLEAPAVSALDQLEQLKSQIGEDEEAE